MSDFYDAADADKDKYLNPEDRKVWIVSMRVRLAKRGEWGDTRQSSEYRYYEHCDMVVLD